MLSSVRFFSHSGFRPFPRVTSLPQHAVPRLTTFREQIASSKPLKSFSANAPRPPIRKQILFATVTSVAVFAWAANETNKDAEKWLAKARGVGSRFFNFGAPPELALRSLKKRALLNDIQQFYEGFMTKIQSWPLRLKTDISWLYVQIAQPIVDLDEGKRVAAGLAILCATTWLSWKSSRLRPFMRKYFTHDPLSGRSITLLTSMFSHQSFIHLAFNCMALTSCGSGLWVYFLLLEEPSAQRTGLREADTSWLCFAFFISAGLFSALISHIASARLLFPRLVARASSSVSATSRATSNVSAGAKAALRKAASGIRPSIGISGAVYAGFILISLAHPATLATLTFLPTYPVPIPWLAGAAVAFDIYGVIRGLQFFDHYAHLGGALFGLLYYQYGPLCWDLWRLLLSRRPKQPHQVKSGS